MKDIRETDKEFLKQAEGQGIYVTSFIEDGVLKIRLPKSDDASEIYNQRDFMDFMRFVAFEISRRQKEGKNDEESLYQPAEHLQTRLRRGDETPRARVG